MGLLNRIVGAIFTAREADEGHALGSAIQRAAPRDEEETGDTGAVRAAARVAISSSVGMIFTTLIAPSGDTREDLAQAEQLMSPLAKTADALELYDAAQSLIARGADTILLPPATPGGHRDALALAFRVPVLIRDTDHDRTAAALFEAPGGTATPAPFKIGVVGGVGPAATVDFLDKLVRSTPAMKDQEHLRIVLEQNPQIPDRTGHLLGTSPADPGIALYAACRLLIDNGAKLIAIPCNTAHAYVNLIQPRIAVPVVHLLNETIDHIVDAFGVDAKVGLLATDGTISSGVYKDAAARRNMQLMLPDAEHQTGIMDAIYGPRGIKAGSLEGECVSQLLRAIEHLAARGAEVLILGCTELPLILEHDRHFPVGKYHVALVDPTLILARRCVALARSSSDA